MKKARFAGLGLAALVGLGCVGGRAEFPSTTGLALSHVVLYRNGVGYFERVGQVDGDVLSLKVRKDQVNDMLKSLTVVERATGKAVSVSMPLDPQTWANAALATLAPGRGSLAEVLDALRGTDVVLTTTEGDLHGRIAMVEAIDGVPDVPDRAAQPPSGDAVLQDHRVTLMHDEELLVARLSRVKAVKLMDGDLAMQFQRSLDATAGEGMFQQVDVDIRLTGASSHDLLVSYVVQAPMWKPTYRVVLPKEGKGKALLQGWAVVDNTSGEDWRDVKLGLTSGAPIAFRYDLHTPRNVDRVDLTETGVQKQAAAAVGEASYETPPPAAAPAPMPAEEKAAEAEAGEMDEDAAKDSGNDYLPRRDMAPGTKKSTRGPMARAFAAPAKPMPAATAAGMAPMSPPMGTAAPEAQAIDYDSLRKSTLAQARASQVAGLTRFDLEDAVTVPDGTSTMVAVINSSVDGEETFLYKPGGAGMGYESNPYRVVRFRNTTPFVLEPGPISIYAGGSFVGEGLSEAVGANTSATIPFAVEPGILVTSVVSHDGDDIHVLRVVRGVLEVESFSRAVTKWSVKGPTLNDGFTVLIRHPKTGFSYELAKRPPGTEDLAGAYLVPITVAKGAHEGSIDVVEQTPSRFSISIWEGRAEQLLTALLTSNDVSAEARQKLQPIVTQRQTIGKLDTEIDGITRQRQELDQRAEETRQNLEAIKKDSAAGALRARLSARLEEFTKEGDRLGRQLVELQSKRLEAKIALEDAMQNLDLTVGTPATKPAP